MEWIDINKQKPPMGEGKPILVTDGEQITICELNKGQNFLGQEYISMRGCGFGGNEWEYNFDYKDIKYWMNTPKLPGDDNE